MSNANQNSRQNQSNAGATPAAAAAPAKPKVQTVIAVHSLKYKGKLHAPGTEIELDEGLATTLMGTGAVKAKSVELKAKEKVE